MIVALLSKNPADPVTMHMAYRDDDLTGNLTNHEYTYTKPKQTLITLAAREHTHIHIHMHA